jgi:hypothetical protein
MMSCYLRYLNEIFSLAGISVNQQNKKHLDEIVHKLMGTHYKDCSSTWLEFKQHVLVSEEGRREFIERLKTELKEEKAA